MKVNLFSSSIFVHPKINTEMPVTLGAGPLGLHKFLWNFLLTDAICALSRDGLTFDGIKPALVCSMREHPQSVKRLKKNLSHHKMFSKCSTCSAQVNYY